jgi:hypothetical protein
MFRTGMIVFLFLLLVVVNRPVLYTVQVLGGYEAMSVEFCIHLLYGCVINNGCPSVLHLDIPHQVVI